MGSDGEFSVIKLFENVLKSSMRQGKLSKIVKELRVERKKNELFYNDLTIRLHPFSSNSQLSKGFTISKP